LCEGTVCASRYRRVGYRICVKLCHTDTRTHTRTLGHTLTRTGVATLQAKTEAEAATWVKLCGIARKWAENHKRVKMGLMPLSDAGNRIVGARKIFKRSNNVSLQYTVCVCLESSGALLKSYSTASCLKDLSVCSKQSILVLSLACNLVACLSRCVCLLLVFVARTYKVQSRPTVKCLVFGGVSSVARMQKECVCSSVCGWMDPVRSVCGCMDAQGVCVVGWIKECVWLDGCTKSVCECGVCVVGWIDKESLCLQAQQVVCPPVCCSIVPLVPLCFS